MDMTRAQRDKIEELGVWSLAELADVASPDNTESPGGKWLSSIRHAAIEGHDRIGTGEEPYDIAHELADDGVPIYTHKKWSVFLDVCAYQEEPEQGEWPSDLDKVASVALYQIAERLILAIWDGISNGDYDPDDDSE